METTVSKRYSAQNKFVYESKPYYDYFRKIPFQSLKRLMDKNNLTLDGQSVLIASCGCGIDAYFLGKFYSPAKLYFSDIHMLAFEKTRSNFQSEPCIFADNCLLPFKDGSFDYVFVAASLHHLSEPLKGVYELLRVARKGLIIIEPNDSWLTRLFEKLGLVHEYEEHGNYVYRFSRRDVTKIAKAQFRECYLIRFFAIHRTAKSGLEFFLLRALNDLANSVFSSIGNYIVFIINKNKIKNAPKK